MSRIWPSLVGALALALPAPHASASSISVGMCGDPSLRIVIPLDGEPSPQPDHGCCKGACHAGCERKQQRGQRGRTGTAD